MGVWGVNGQASGSEDVRSKGAQSEVGMVSRAGQWARLWAEPLGYVWLQKR